MNQPKINACGCPGRFAPPTSRREFLEQASTGFGMLALAGLMADRAYAGLTPASTSSSVSAPHFTPRARNVIFLFMDGGPSHVDTFDPKPALKKHEGKKIGEAIRRERLAAVETFRSGFQPP